MCPICKVNTEDESHFLHCRHWACNVAVMEITDQAKRTAIQYTINPMIQRIFKTKLQLQRVAQSYGEAYQKANEIKENIGNDSIFKGIIAQQWTTIQCSYLHNHQLSTDKN